MDGVWSSVPNNCGKNRSITGPTCDPAFPRLYPRHRPQRPEGERWLEQPDRWSLILGYRGRHCPAENNTVWIIKQEALHLWIYLFEVHTVYWQILNVVKEEWTFWWNVCCMSVPHFTVIHSVFHTKYRHVCRGSSRPRRFILQGTQTSGYNSKSIHLMVVDIFQSESNWWTDQARLTFLILKTIWLAGLQFLSEP